MSEAETYNWKAKSNCLVFFDNIFCQTKLVSKHKLKTDNYRCVN